MTRIMSITDAAAAFAEAAALTLDEARRILDTAAKEFGLTADLIPTQGATVFELIDTEGAVIRMQDGQRFRYTSRTTARTGQVILSKVRGERLSIVERAH